MAKTPSVSDKPKKTTGSRSKATAAPSSLVKKKTSKKAPAKKAGAKKVSKVIEPEIVDTEIIEPEVIEPEIVDPDSDELYKAEDDSWSDEEAPRVVSPVIVDPDDKPSSDSKALTTTDPVAIYLSELRKYPLLTKEQEQELAIRYRESGDPKAAEMLVTSNLRFVVKIAAEYSRFGAKLIDLVQEGNVGLMHAVKEFNPYKGVRLITYAVWWIRGYIQEYLMRQYSMVRIGTTQNQRKLFYRLQKEREALEAIGKEPSYALLAGRLGVSEEEVETMTKRMSGRDLSLNAPIDGENSAASLLDFESSTEEAADEALGHAEELDVLKHNLDDLRPTLSEKETFILEKRVLSDEPLTLQEIGDHYGTTREAVRQLEARLIGKIRAAVTKSLGADSSDSDD